MQRSITIAYAYTSNEEAQKLLDEALKFGNSVAMDFDKAHEPDADHYAVWGPGLDGLYQPSRARPARHNVSPEPSASARRRSIAGMTPPVRDRQRPVYVPPDGNCDLRKDIAEELV
ncbi:MAG TPA: hypothetical protein VFW00_03110 [Rhodocyclaceae bacterium]|nr:hypothetical protein [Rhodocyclaceae bacterium]